MKNGARLYDFVIVRNGRDVERLPKVDEAFRKKEPSDLVYVELLATGYRAHVLRPGPDL
jgi:hypothetical protein